MSTVYLLHFSAPLGNPNNPRALAAHYIGWAQNLDDRLKAHRAGQGCALTRAAVERGISFEVVQTWPGDRRLERCLKNLKAAPRLCPHCGRRHPRGPLCLPATYHQLDLELDDWPAPPKPRGLDWFEISYYRRRLPPALVAPIESIALPLPDWYIPF